MDPGSGQTIIREDKLRSPRWSGESVYLKGFQGASQAVPIARAKLLVGGVFRELDVAVIDHMDFEAILGRDFPQIWEIGCAIRRNNTMAITRSQSQPEEHSLTEEEITVDEEESQTEEHSLTEEEMTVDEEESLITEEESLAEQEVEKEEQSLVEGDPPEDEKIVLLEKGGEAFKKAQEEDESLDLCRENTTEGPTQKGDSFTRDGLLYRQAEEGQSQLYLPKSHRDLVFKAVHGNPWAGHLGQRKTTQRITTRFFWPGIHQDVARLIGGCQECQRVARHTRHKAPLMPLPIIETPFSKVAIDVVGPLPRTKAGKRFILTLMDFSTRYPEAFALRTVDSKSVLEALLQVFSRMGIPGQVLSDNGANLTGTLMKEVFILLGIKSIRSSPYHPQSNGMLERFHATLKGMLRKTKGSFQGQWDEALQTALFAYREVPCESTGFSPFELMFGRQARGPLDLIKENWEGPSTTNSNIIKYVTTLADRFYEIRKAVLSHETEAKEKGKKWYDKGARLRTFEPKEKVWLLQPDSSSKMLAGWKGPFEVIKSAGPVTYLVKMGNGRTRAIHVNLLAKWRPEISILSIRETPLDREEEPPVRAYEEESGTVTLGAELSSEQRAEWKELKRDFQEQFNDHPGEAIGVQMNIVVADHQPPTHLRPYRLNPVKRKILQEEVQKLLAAGIIRPSLSPWSSPVVLVTKPDKTWRLCLDYRTLNSVTVSDPFPMPRTEELLDIIGRAKFITTLDMSKGYWQIPMAADSIPKTAFSTEDGKFEFLRMPFGLKGAPSTFQRFVNNILSEVRDYARAYMDDLVIFSDTWQDHVRHLRTVLNIIKKWNLTLKEAKCQVGMKFCRFLGHRVGMGLIKPSLHKVTAVMEFTRPQTKKQVRAFLGLAGYYRRFIPEFSLITAPLTELTKQIHPDRVIWTDELQKIFQQIKDTLTSEPVLSCTDWNKPFTLQTDASGLGVAAVLCQEHEDGDHPVAFYSRKFLPAERNYSGVEQECLAVVNGVKHFDVYLSGGVFTIVTDNRALVYLKRFQDDKSRLIRWALALQPYQYKVIHRPGTSNGNADGLSRQFSETTASPFLEGGVSVKESPIDPLTTSEPAQIQRIDHRKD